MKTTILSTILTLSCVLTTMAQQAQTHSAVSGSNESSATIGPANSIGIQPGSRLAAELQKSIDARKARVGDRVLLKTTESLKAQGHTVVRKGANLVGHITEIERKTANSPASRLGLVFDRLESGSLTVPITATIVSLTSASANSQASSEDSFGTSSGGSSSIMQRQSSSGSQSSGLLGGTTGVVGGVMNTTTSTVGNVVGSTAATAGSSVNSTTQAIGGASSGLGRTLSRVQISESSTTSAEGGSTLSLRGENLKLEKGTTFNLLISQSSSAMASKEP